MSYGEPLTGPPSYRARFQEDSGKTGETFSIEITMSPPGEGAWTEAGLDAVFQSLVDLVDAAPLFLFTEAGKRTQVDAQVTLTEPEPAP